jgi:hypothetical protein
MSALCRTQRAQPFLALGGASPDEAAFADAATALDGEVGEESKLHGRVGEWEGGRMLTEGGLEPNTTTPWTVYQVFWIYPGFLDLPMLRVRNYPPMITWGAPFLVMRGVVQIGCLCKWWCRAGWIRRECSKNLS